MRKSPRSGAMFGLAWMNILNSLIPFLFFMVLINGVVDFEHWKHLMLILLACICPFYIYGMVLCGVGISRICRSVIKSKIGSCIAAVIGVFTPPFLGLILIPVLFQRKKFFAVLLAIMGMAYYLLVAYNSLNAISGIWLGTLFYLAALAAVPDKKRLSKWFVLPMVIALASHLYFICYDVGLQHDVQVLREALSRTVERSVEIPDFWERDAGGFPPDFEPLKTLFANIPEADYSECSNKEETQTKLLAYQKKNPMFIQALEKFLELPVCAVSHKIPKDGLIPSMVMPELSAFRRATVYLVLKISAAPENKNEVNLRNQHLIDLRDRLLQNPLLISTLSALHIETERLRVLATVLVTGAYSKAEIYQLIGTPVDWEKYLKFAYGDEISSFKTLMDMLIDKIETEVSEPYPRIKIHLPQFLKVYFYRDYRFALQSMIKACAVPTNLSGVEKAELAEVDNAVIHRNSYMLSEMFMPVLGSTYAVIARVADIRKMALLAAEVMEYRKQHGKLPDDLSFLPEIPQSDLNHQPLMYEKTEDGFRTFGNTDKGQKPDKKDLRHSYYVRLQPEK